MWSPVFGAPRNDSCSAVPWNVIGPLEPGMNIEIVRFRPSTAGFTSSSSSPPLCAHSTCTASLNRSSPCASVTEVLPPKVTTRLVPDTVAPENDCSPMATRPNVTGPVPQVFESRTRMVLAQMSGLTIMRRVWLTA